MSLKIITSHHQNPLFRNTCEKETVKKVRNVDVSLIILTALSLLVVLHLLGTHPLWGHLLWNAAVVLSDLLDGPEFSMQGKK